MEIGDRVKHKTTNTEYEVEYICKNSGYLLLWNENVGRYCVFSLKRIEKLPPEPKFEIGDSVFCESLNFSGEIVYISQYLPHYDNYKYAVGNEEELLAICEPYLKGGNEND